MSALILAAAAAASTAPATLAIGEAEKPVLLDNRCDAREWKGAAKTAIAPGVELLAMADEDYVYLCWTLPPESLGALDLYLIVEGETTRDLHVSAQVGERSLGPTGWSEFVWGEHSGWYGPPVRSTGYEAVPDGRRAVRFADSAAREVQIDRDVSRGRWALMFQLHAVGPGRSRSITWPQGAVPEDTRTFVEVDLSE